MRKIRQFCESSLFSNSESSEKTKIWKWFPRLMALGFAMRLVVALTCDCHAYADEVMNYLEQAHRVVFGYGFIPWEYRFGVRSWLIPAIPALPLWLSKTAGLDSPSFYVPFVYSFNALISMAIPAGMYFFTRRAVSENAARYALVFGLFWYELIAFAPRALAEPYATAAFFGALALMSRKNGKKIFITGLLLGLTATLRWQYAPVAGAAGLMWLISIDDGRKAAVTGGILSIAIWGVVDFFTWGQFFHSVTMMLQISTVFQTLEFFASHTTPWHKGIVWLVTASLGVHLISLAGVAKRQRLFFPVFAALLVLSVHMLPEGIEYRNIFIVIPLSLMAAGGFAGLTGGRTRIIACGLFLCISLTGLLGKLPKMELALGDYTRYINASTTPGISAAKQLSQLPSAQVRGVLWLAGNQIFSGGYFYLHKNIPSYFMADPQDRAIVSEHLNSGGKLNTVATHIISPQPVSRLEGFEERGGIPGWPGWRIYENKNPKTVRRLAGFYYDTFDPNWMNIGRRAKEAGIETDPLPLTPYKKQ
ncbi:MAG: hypothetical protein OXF42_07290 [Candidatus Dadabacteria bacterium]|nr:hypothetical protein [Candidatus Dadabacteria bacterium]